MNEDKYILEITKENNSIKGHLQSIIELNINNKLEITNTDYDFEVTSILCDLTTFENTSEFETDNSVYPIYNEENAFGKPKKINKNEDTYYYVLTNYIKKSIQKNREISIKELEKLRLFFNIKLNYSISFKEKDKLYETYKTIGKNIPEYTYTPLQYGFCDVSTIFKADNKIPHKYIYYCSNLTDVIYSILHYLVLHNYTKIRQCNHCGKLYYYNHSNQKYCNRKSPYKHYKYDYTNLECEQAVRNIKQRLSERNKSIQTNLNNYYPHSIDEYLDCWYQYKDDVDKCSSIDNLKRLDDFVKPDNISKRFYIKRTIDEQLKG